MSGAVRFAFRGRIDELDFEARSRLMDRRSDGSAGTRETVESILRAVRTRGDAPLFEMAETFDGVSLEALEVPRERWTEALERLDPGVRRALERAARNIETFHRAQLPGEVEVETEAGVRVGRRFVPLPAVGVYAPGGTAAYPSSVLMGVVPARTAGVPEIILCSPPAEEGIPPTAVLAAARIGGATRVFSVGGAGAIGAMAFGTPSVPRCSALVGPGNRWVLEAKRQVAGDVVIDSPAGPSELLVLADGTASPERIASELIAQAEHDVEAAVLLVTTEDGLPGRTEQVVAGRRAGAPREPIVRDALARRGGLLVASSVSEARDFARAWAPEHLAIYTADPASDLAEIPTAGTVFLGGTTSVAHGDYLTGANHVLPTAGTARSFSGLSALDFVRSYTWQEVTTAGARRLADDVARLAEAEGLPGHATAARSAAGGAS